MDTEVENYKKSISKEHKQLTLMKKGCQWEGHLCQMFDLSHLPKKLN